MVSKSFDSCNFALFSTLRRYCITGVVSTEGGGYSGLSMDTSIHGVVDKEHGVWRYRYLRRCFHSGQGQPQQSSARLAVPPSTSLLIRVQIAVLLSLSNAVVVGTRSTQRQKRVLVAGALNSKHSCSNSLLCRLELFDNSMIIHPMYATEDPFSVDIDYPLCQTRSKYAKQGLWRLIQVITFPPTV